MACKGKSLKVELLVSRRHAVHDPEHLLLANILVPPNAVLYLSAVLLPTLTDELQRTLDAVHHEGAVTTLTKIEGAVIAATEDQDTTTAIVVALAMKIVILVRLAIVDAVMTTVLEALTATLLVERTDTVGETTTVAGIILQEILGAAMGMLLPGNPTEVETETILQMIGTPVAEFAC